ncbi:MAG: deoxyribonuclease IV, partial [Propionicimonas sp.]
MLMGAHVDQSDPIAEAQARGATLSQFFLGDPQGWKGPVVAYPGGAAALKADAEAAGVALYV